MCGVLKLRGGIQEVLTLEELVSSGLSFDKILITPYDYKEIYDALVMRGIDKARLSVMKYDGVMWARESIGLRCFGQHFDDLIVAAIFGQIGIERPSYIDLGANQPCEISNTMLLYANGCRGINVDASPANIEACRITRPEDTNLNIGVADQEGELLFYVFDDRSGLNTFSKEEAERISRGGKMEIERVDRIRVTTLEKLVETYCPDGFPDFLDCDIEGYDYRVLSSYDMKENGPKVVLVEVRPRDIELFDAMLDGQGYYRFCRIGGNNIYVRKEFASQLLHMEMG